LLTIWSQDLLHCPVRKKKTPRTTWSPGHDPVTVKGASEKIATLQCRQSTLKQLIFESPRRSEFRSIPSHDKTAHEDHGVTTSRRAVSIILRRQYRWLSSLSAEPRVPYITGASYTSYYPLTGRHYPCADYPRSDDAPHDCLLWGLPQTATPVMKVAPRGCHAVTNSRGIAQHSDTVAFAQCGRRAAKFQVRRIQRVLGYCIPRSTACCPSSNCTRRRCVNSRRVSSSATISRWTTCQQHSPSSRVACIFQGCISSVTPHPYPPSTSLPTPTFVSVERKAMSFPSFPSLPRTFL